MSEFLFSENYSMARDMEDEIGAVNEALKAFVFSALESKGYKVDVIESGDFGDSFRKNSGVWFRLSRVWRGWRFGMYLYGERLLDDTRDGKPVITMYCQHESVVDKFRPSRCDLCIDIVKFEVESLLERGNFYGWRVRPCKSIATRRVVSLAEQIRLHPFVSFAMDGRFGALDGHPIKETVSYVGRDFITRLCKRASVKALTAYAKPRVAIARRLPCVDECTFVDRGEHWYPRMVVRCRLRGMPTDAELEFVDKLLPRDYYGGTSWSESLRVEITGSVDGKEMRFTVKDDDE